MKSVKLIKFVLLTECADNTVAISEYIVQMLPDVEAYLNATNQMDNFLTESFKRFIDRTQLDPEKPPPGWTMKKPVKMVRAIDPSILPKDTYFRPAWRCDYSKPDPAIKIDVDVARELQRNFIQSQTLPIIDQLDKDFMQALQDKNENKQKEIVIKKAKLKLLSQHPAFNTMDLEELKNIKIESLLADL